MTFISCSRKRTGDCAIVSFSLSSSFSFFLSFLSPISDLSPLYIYSFFIYYSLYPSLSPFIIFISVTPLFIFPPSSSLFYSSKPPFSLPLSVLRLSSFIFLFFVSFYPSSLLKHFPLSFFPSFIFLLLIIFFPLFYSLYFSPLSSLSPLPPSLSLIPHLTFSTYLLLPLFLSFPYFPSTALFTPLVFFSFFSSFSSHPFLISLQTPNLQTSRYTLKGLRYSAPTA